MAAKPLYTVIAVVGIAAASGAAWWYQNKPKSSPEGAQATSAASAPARGASGAGGAPAVEIARVEVMRLTDDGDHRVEGLSCHLLRAWEESGERRLHANTSM